MLLFLAFIAVPLIEIGLFIQVGGAIGLWQTLFIVVFTAILGTWMLRTQGIMALSNLQRSFGELRDPTEPLAHGAMILFSGALLLTPGFFTDGVGFLLLFPPVRSAVIKYVRSRVKVQSFSTSQTAHPHRHAQDGDIIDGEFQEVEPPKSPTHNPSGWTKH